MMMSRDAAKEAMEERILATTDRLFYGQGIRAVGGRIPGTPRAPFLRPGPRGGGVDTIAAETGISKRTLYNYFPSKDALIVAYLSRRLTPTRTTDMPPAAQVLGDFD